MCVCVCAWGCVCVCVSGGLTPCGRVCVGPEFIPITTGTCVRSNALYIECLIR